MANRNKLNLECSSKVVKTHNSLTITKESTSDTTIWKGGLVTDNFETYYLDKNFKRKNS